MEEVKTWKSVHIKQVDNYTYYYYYDYIEYPKTISHVNLRSPLVLWRMVTAYLMPLIIVVSVTTNVLTLKILQRLGFENPGDWIIFSMAVSDVIHILTIAMDYVTDAVETADKAWFCYVRLATVIFFHHWKYRAWGFNIALVALLATERITAACLPLASVRFFRPVVVKSLIVFLIAAVIFGTFPTLFLFYDYECRAGERFKIQPSMFLYLHNYTALLLDHVSKVFYEIIPLAIIFASPLVLCIGVPVFYHTLAKNPSRMASVYGVRRLRLFKIMLVVLAMKIIASIPAATQTVIFLFNLENIVSTFVSNVLFITVTRYWHVIFSMSNFFTYLLMDQKFSSSLKICSAKDCRKVTNKI